jgi:membrane AbrB-like protein
MLAWPALAGATAALALALDAAGLQSPALFAALLVGIGAALAAREAETSPPAAHAAARRARLPSVPGWAFRAAQAVTGVALASHVRSSALHAVANAWLPVLVVVGGTLALSLLAGVLLSRLTGLDPATAALGSVAGGASGIVSIANDLHADDRLVAVLQYVRVLIVVLATPLIVEVALPGHHAVPAHAGATGTLGDLRGWALTAACCMVGGTVAARARMAAGALLGPMLLAAALALGGVGFTVPVMLREPAFALIGLQIGLRFTPETVRLARRLLLPALLGVLALMLACAGLALLLVATSSETFLSAYLATTPGGLYAVLAAAFGSGADTTFILSVQTLRVLVMVLLAPLAVRRYVSFAGRTVCKSVG